MTNPFFFLALLALGVGWGITVPLTKIAVSTGHSPLGLIAWQMVFSIIILGAVCLIRGKWPILTRRILVHFAIIGAVGNVLPSLAYYVAAVALPAGIMAIVIATAPMFSLIIALAIRVERFSPLRILGVSLGAAAVIMLAAPGASLPDPALALFVLVALFAPFFYGVEANYLATRAPQGIDPVVTLFGASIAGLIIAGPIVWFGGYGVDLYRPWAGPEWALLTSSVIGAFAYAGYIALVAAAGPVFSIQVAYVVTISGVLLSALMLDESYTRFVWLALAIMLAGITLVQPRTKRAV